MTDLKDFITQALNEFGLEKMPIFGDPLRQRIAQRAFDLAMPWTKEKTNSSMEPVTKQTRLGVQNGK